MAACIIFPCLQGCSFILQIKNMAGSDEDWEFLVWVQSRFTAEWDPRQGYNFNTPPSILSIDVAMIAIGTEKLPHLHCLNLQLTSLGIICLQALSFVK